MFEHMAKRLTLLITVVAIVWSAGSSSARAEVEVVATLSDLAWLVQEVGGDRVSVTALCEDHRDPHTLPAKPSLARRLKQADLLVYNGLELEIGWLPVLIEAARNPRIAAGRPGELDCSRALPTEALLGVPAGDVDRSRGDVHAQGNPHYLLDPRLGAAVADLIAERLAQLDPDGAALYRQRAGDLRGRLEARLPGWEAQAAALPSRRVIVYHQQWEYLAAWLDLDIIDAIENRPGIAPSPRHVEELIRRGRVQAPVLVIAAPWDHVDAAKRVAREVGGKLAVLPAAAPPGQSYLDLFGEIVDRLAAAEQP